MKKIKILTRTATKEDKRYSRVLSLFFIIIVAAILLSSIAVVLLIAWLFLGTGIWTREELIDSKVFIVFVFTATSIVVGVGITLLLGRFILEPFTTLINGMMSLSRGDYSTRIHLGKYMGMAQLTDGFNNMAEELEKADSLRTDFINNFSHEFKTPIASIKTLIELLQKEDLPIEKQREYLSVIDEETARLLDMSTNVLNLSKVESQSILTHLAEYNLSEQIRNCILMLSKKWERKHLNLALDFDEYVVIADQDLMTQVWLNLLDNAIKFSDEGTDLTVRIRQERENISVDVENTGIAISPEDRERIFQKFYQADPTHTKEGNGIGLSIVKRIVELHKGSITVDCREGKTVFTVVMPMN